MKTHNIRVSAQTYKKLLSFKADTIKAHEYAPSFDEIVSDALDFIESMEMSYRQQQNLPKIRI